MKTLCFTTIPLAILACMTISLPRATVAQEPPKAETKSVGIVLETGHYHNFHSESFSTRAHRKSFSTGEVVLFLEFKFEQGGKSHYFNVLPEAAREFLALHAKAAVRSRGLNLGENVAGARLEWIGKGFLSDDLELAARWPLTEWQWRELRLPSLVEALERTLQDADTLKANKPVTPW